MKSLFLFLWWQDSLTQVKDIFIGPHRRDIIQVWNLDKALKLRYSFNLRGAHVKFSLVQLWHILINPWHILGYSLVRSLRSMDSQQRPRHFQKPLDQCFPPGELQHRRWPPWKSSSPPRSSLVLSQWWYINQWLEMGKKNACSRLHWWHYGHLNQGLKTWQILQGSWNRGSKRFRR